VDTMGFTLLMVTAVAVVDGVNVSPSRGEGGRKRVRQTLLDYHAGLCACWWREGSRLIGRIGRGWRPLVVRGDVERFFFREVDSGSGVRYVCICRLEWADAG